MANIRVNEKWENENTDDNHFCVINAWKKASNTWKKCQSLEKEFCLYMCVSKIEKNPKMWYW